MKGGSMGSFTNYYSKCPKLGKFVHNVIKHQILYKVTQRYTDPYQKRNYLIAVM